MAKLSRLGWAVPVGFGLLLAACVEPAGAARIVGPDGTQMLHVHCADDQVACFQLAGELCPHGYDLSPIFDPHDGNFLVRCREPNRAGAIAATPQLPPVQATQPAQSAPPATVHARPPEPGWPPSEVARPAEPWPAPSAGAPQPQSAIGDVDIGY